MKKIIKNSTLALIFLNIFCIYTEDNKYNVTAKIDSSDAPRAATIIAEGFKAMAGVAKTNTYFHVNTQHFVDVAKIFANHKWPELSVFLNSNKTDIHSEHFTQMASEFRKAAQELKPTLDVSPETKDALLKLGQSLEKASEKLSSISKIDFNVSPEILAALQKMDPSKLAEILRELKNINPKVRAELALEPKTGFVISGIIAGMLSGVIGGLLAHKRIIQDRELTKADGVAAGTALALLVGGFALIRYSAVLAGIA